MKLNKSLHTIYPTVYNPLRAFVCVVYAICICNLGGLQESLCYKHIASLLKMHGIYRGAVVWLHCKTFVIILFFAKYITQLRVNYFLVKFEYIIQGIWKVKIRNDAERALYISSYERQINFYLFSGDLKTQEFINRGQCF